MNSLIQNFHEDKKKPYLIRTKYIKRIQVYPQPPTQVMLCATLLHYGSFPFASVAGSESRPSSCGIFISSSHDRN